MKNTSEFMKHKKRKIVKRKMHNMQNVIANATSVFVAEGWKFFILIVIVIIGLFTINY